MALSMSALVVLFGGFFIGKEYAWPLISQNSRVQRVQQIATSGIVSTEAEPDSKNAEPIREEDELLTALINDKLDTYPTDQKWSVFVYDLNTERTASVNIDATHTAGSLYKLYLIEALEKKLPFDQWQWTWVAGMPIKDCVSKMLQVEDDPCAEDLTEYIGWENVQQLIQKSGFKNTKLTAKDGRETTAADVGELLSRMKKGQMLSDFARRFVFDVLYQQSPNKGIAKGCKKNCRTANKMAELNNTAHDVGIVTHGKHNYVVVIMSEGGSFKQITELTKLIELEFAP